MQPPTQALHRTQLMTSINLIRVSAPGGRPRKVSRIELKHSLRMASQC